MYKIDYQISGNTPNFTTTLFKGDIAITAHTSSVSGITERFGSLQYDQTDYKLVLSDAVNNTVEYPFDTVRPVNLDDFNGSVGIIRTLPDGRLAIGGKFTTYSGITSQRLIILESNGDINQAFPNGFMEGYIGTSNTLNSNDTTPTDTGVNDIYYDNGYLIVVGNFTVYNNVEYRHIVKISLTGVVNTTFSVVGSNGGFSGRIDPPGAATPTHTSVSFIEMVNSTEILIGGNFTEYRTTSRKSACIINVNTGALNTSFIPEVASITFRCALITNNIVYLGGDFDIDVNGCMVRKIMSYYLTNGNVNTNFIKTSDNNYGFYPDAGSTLLGSVYKIIESAGKILVMGQFGKFQVGETIYTQHKKIIRLNLDGTLDTTFNGGSSTYYGMSGNNNLTASNVLNAVVDLNTNKIYVCGRFHNYNGIEAHHIIRILQNGNLDTTFSGYTSIIGNPVFDYVQFIELSGIDKLLIGGIFSQYKDPVTNVIDNSVNAIRVRNNGTLI